jgi:hypothetical protein
MLCLIEQDESGQIVDFCLAQDEHALRQVLHRRSELQDVQQWLYVKEVVPPGIHRLREGLTLLVR